MEKTLEGKNALRKQLRNTGCFDGAQAWTKWRANVLTRYIYPGL